MPSPLTSGAATVHMATLTSNPSLGWSYYEMLAANGVTPKCRPRLQPAGKHSFSPFGPLRAKITDSRAAAAVRYAASPAPS